MTERNRTRFVAARRRAARLASSSSVSVSRLAYSLLADSNPTPGGDDFMPKIGDEEVGATLINVFETDPDDQQALVDEIRANTESMGELQGFVSLGLHRSLDGERVLNYVQFESQDAFEALRDSRDWEAEMGDAMAAAEPDPHFYEVVLTHEASQ